MNDYSDADPLATRDFPAGGLDDTLQSNHRPRKSGSGSLEIRCPNCHETTEVAVDTTLTNLTCVACGTGFSLIDQSQATRMAPPLTQMGRFELIERLGVGGFGSVWKARDKQLDRTVALKVPRAGDMTVEEQEKFFREARAAAQLRHPGIVSVHEVGRDGENVYIVSDFVRGVTLSDWLTGQQLTGREAAELCAKIADALHHAHQHGVVHRDLKPGNIIMDGDGNPHLMDFGLARREAGEVTVTTDGQVLGTPGYMSPEQAKGEAHTADRRSDIYSLGVILFKFLTGELPFRGNARMVMHQVIHNEPRSPRSLNDRVPRDLDTICIKCLQKDPSKRYQQADQLIADLRRFLKGQPIEARPIGRIERFWRSCRRAPLVASLAAAAAALLIAVAVVGWWGYANTKRALNQADENYGIALEAVDETLTVFGGDLLENVPQMEEPRRELLRKALKSYQGLLEQKPNDIETRFRVAQAYYRVADIHRKFNEEREGKDAFEQAVELFNGLATDFPAEPEYRNQLGMAYDYFGELLRDGNDVEQAENKYNSALTVQRKLVEQFPKNRKYKQELSRTLNNLGILLMETGEYPRAEESLRNSLVILVKLSQSYPKEVDYQQEQARTRFNLGNLLTDTERSSEAEPEYRRAVDLLGVVVEQHPDVHDYRCRLGVSLVNLGNCIRNNPKPDEAEELRVKKAVALFSEAVGHFSELTTNYRRIPLYKKELANAHNSLATAFLDIKDYRNAGRNWDKARGLYLQLIKESPKSAEYKSLLGVILGGQADLDARLENEQHDLKRARATLEEAISLQKAAIKLNPHNPAYDKRLAGHINFLNNLTSQQESPPKTAN